METPNTKVLNWLYKNYDFLFVSHIFLLKESSKETREIMTSDFLM